MSICKARVWNPKIDKIQHRLNRAHSWRDEVNLRIDRFANSGLADRDFRIALQGSFWPGYSEALVYELLEGKDFGDRKVGVGPDFLIQHEGQNVWIEVVCPQPKNIPSKFNDLNFLESELAYSPPTKAIALRWTAAIAEKNAKLDRYLRKNTIGSNDVYIIAVNAARLGLSHFNTIGISQHPIAAEICLGFGGLQVRIDPRTGKVIEKEGLSYRDSITNHNDSEVPTDLFWRESHSGISAIWALSVGNCMLGDRSYLIHNPRAINPAPRGLLPVMNEYYADESGDDCVLLFD